MNELLEQFLKEEGMGKELVKAARDQLLGPLAPVATIGAEVGANLAKKLSNKDMAILLSADKDDLILAPIKHVHKSSGHRKLANHGYLRYGAGQHKGKSWVGFWITDKGKAIVKDYKKDEKDVDESINEFDIKKSLQAGALAAGLMLGGQVDAVQTTEPVKVEQSVRAKIDLYKIAAIESSNNPMAQNKKTGARGICQIMPTTWEEVTRMMHKTWSFSEAFDPIKNKAVANYYLNTEIPRLLKHFKFNDTVDNRLIAYNFGVGNMVKLRDKHKVTWQQHIPKESSNYILKYNGIK